MLDSFFNPRSVAVIGASMKPRSLGHVLLKNIVEGGYEGDVYPINRAQAPYLDSEHTRPSQMLKLSLTSQS